jgi:uroporphyrinogen decarboxylase
MRQAGRYQAEYREIRKHHTLEEICLEPELCAKVTMLPVDQLDVDVAILFSDIMIPLGPIGVDFSLVKDKGPEIANPFRSLRDVEQLREINPQVDLPHVLDTIAMLKQQLEVPLIGFSGAPFTLASYMIEGGPSRDYLKTKTLMHQNPDAWELLMDKLGNMVVTYLRAQVLAGADAVQVFDSWVGSLAPVDYRRYVMPTMKKIFSELQDLAVPSIYFGVNTGELLSDFSEVGASVVGVDWRVPIQVARERTNRQVALQGNLDPALLFAPWEVIESRARDIIDIGIMEPGFVFNLGHGVLPQVDPNVLKKLTAFVHEYSEYKIGDQGESGWNK